MCAVEDIFQVRVEFFSKDGAEVHVTCVDKTICGVFKKEIALSKLLRLKKLKSCVWS